MKKTMKKNFSIAAMAESDLWNMTPNFEEVAKLIHAARGPISVEKFAVMCGMSVGTLFRTLRGDRKKPLSYQDMKSIASHAVVGSGVTLELLLLASGCECPRSLIEKEESHAICRACEQAVARKVDKKSSCETEKREQILEEISSEAEKEEKDKDFLENLVFFAKSESWKTLKLIVKNKKSLYKSKKFRKTLARYREEKEFSIKEFSICAVNGKEFKPRHMETRDLLLNMIEKGGK